MRVFLTGLLLTCAVLFTGIAGAQTADKRSFEQVLSAGKLRVGVYLLAPYVMKDANGGLIGGDVDVATRIAKDMGITPEFKTYEWDKLIPALQKGEIDIIASGMSITPQRALQVYFSDPYASSGISIATNIKLTAEFQSLSDLNSAQVAIGVIGGTVSEQVAHELFDKAAIKLFSEEAKVEDALVKGLIHAYVRSEPEPRFLALRHPKEIDVPITKPLLATREAFAVRRGDNDFINFLNAWIAARTADAWLASTRSYWFDSLGWQKTPATSATTPAQP